MLTLTMNNNNSDEANQAHSTLCLSDSLLSYTHWHTWQPRNQLFMHNTHTHTGIHVKHKQARLSHPSNQTQAWLSVCVCVCVCVSIWKAVQSGWPDYTHGLRRTQHKNTLKATISYSIFIWSVYLQKQITPSVLFFNHVFFYCYHVFIVFYCVS